MVLRLLSLAFLSLLFVIPFSIYAQPDLTASFECEVSLDIYNGIYDWEAGQSYSGGNKLGSGNKFDKGAVTIANLNDTDGDGIVDVDDDDVVASSIGRNEVDLIKLVIKKQGNDATGNVILRKISGNVRLWESPTKGSSINLDINGEVSYPISELEKTIYIEAIEASSNLRDIEFHLFYNGELKDKVRATAVWVTRTREWRENTVTPIPNTSDLPNCNGHHLRKSLNERWISENQQRYGFGGFYTGQVAGDNSALNKRIGGRILFEFFISPLGAEELVKFDVTRQKKVRGYKMKLFSNTFEQFANIDFPYEEDLDNEKPNDDTNHNTDEDNIPSEQLIYSADIPSNQLLEPNDVAFVVNKIAFHEFVRVLLFDPPQHDELVRGSRASNVTDWHCVYYTKRGEDGGKLIEDNIDASASIPLRNNFSGAVTPMVGNGSISITVNPTANTESYTLMFSPVTDEWVLLDLIGQGGTFPIDASGETWTIINSNLNIVITKGTIPFEENDTFIFNTFNTGSTKINEINIGSFDVTTTP